MFKVMAASAGKRKPDYTTVNLASEQRHTVPTVTDNLMPVNHSHGTVPGLPPLPCWPAPRTKPTGISDESALSGYATESAEARSTDEW